MTRDNTPMRVPGAMGTDPFNKVSDGWISATVKPERGVTYRVWVVTDDKSGFSTYGEWDGEDWERMQAASERQSFSPHFSDYGMIVTHYRKEPEPPPPNTELEKEEGV